MSNTLLERSDKERELLEFVTHPKRFLILKELIQADRPMYIAELAVAINEKTPRNTSFHLNGLAGLGIVKGYFGEVPDAGRAAKFYELTKMGNHLMNSKIHLDI